MPAAIDSNAEDIALMAKIATADHAAFQQLIEKHQAAVIGTIAKMLGSPTEAEDIAQQVFLRLWKSAKHYQPTAKFTTWLYTIVRNLVFNETRRASRKRATSLDAVSDEHGTEMPDPTVQQPDEKALQIELVTAVDEAIERLPDKQRLAVILRQHQHLSYDEIAEVMEMSLSAVKSQLFRAREALKTDLTSFLQRD